MRKYNLKNKDYIKLSNVLFATTSPCDWEMNRLLLLEHMPDTNYNEYVLAEGYHCSCYDFDETDWDCIVVTEEELSKILKDSYGLRLRLKKFLENY